jgi:hypothetical protein
VQELGSRILAPNVRGVGVQVPRDFVQVGRLGMLMCTAVGVKWVLAGLAGEDLVVPEPKHI